MRTITYTEEGHYTITKVVEFSEEKIQELIAAGVLVVDDETDLEVNDSKELWQYFGVETGDCDTYVDFGSFDIERAS